MGSSYIYENEDSTDSLRWLDKLGDKPSNNPEVLEKLQDEIIQTGDAALAYFFANDFPYKTYRMQKVVLDKKDAKYAFFFALNIKNADIKALQSIVLASKKIKYVAKFACFVRRAERKPLESFIIKSKSVKYNDMLLKHIKGTDVKR